MQHLLACAGRGWIDAGFRRGIRDQSRHRRRNRAHSHCKGLGARYPRFNADATQAAGSYGGVMFMIAAVALIIVTIVLVGWPSSMYLMSLTGRFRYRLTPERQAMIAASFSAAAFATSMLSWSRRTTPGGWWTR